MYIRYVSRCVHCICKKHASHALTRNRIIRFLCQQADTSSVSQPWQQTECVFVRRRHQCTQNSQKFDYSISYDISLPRVQRMWTMTCRHCLSHFGQKFGLSQSDGMNTHAFVIAICILPVFYTSCSRCSHLDVNSQMEDFFRHS